MLPNLYHSWVVLLLALKPRLMHSTEVDRGRTARRLLLLGPFEACCDPC